MTHTHRLTSQSERNETPSERADRNFAELVQEVRVAQTGVQILFAFLLTLAFYQSFPRTDTRLKIVLVAALIAAASSALCLMSPVLVHRLTFRSGGKERLVWITHRFALAGMGALSVAMLLAIWLVIAFLFSESVATVVVFVLGAAVLTLWVGVPLHIRTRLRQG